MERLEWALHYAGIGWEVFPVYCILPDGSCSCGSPGCKSAAGKHPRIPGGFKGASKDKATVTKWWGQWPDANIGVATGEKSNLCVVDVDVDKGGKESLEKLLHKSGSLPPTIHQETGGGGWHYFYENDEDTFSCVEPFLPGIDIRAKGGYVVVPPSNHRSGGTYKWTNGNAPVDRKAAHLPAWIKQSFVDKKKEKTETRAKKENRKNRNGDYGEALRRAEAYIRSVDGGVQGQNGSGHCFNAAQALVRGFGLGEQDAFFVLKNEYSPKCKPPWSDKELLHKIKDASAKSTLEEGYLLNAERPERRASSPTPKPREKIEERRVEEEKEEAPKPDNDAVCASLPGAPVSDKIKIPWAYEIGIGGVKHYGAADKNGEVKTKVVVDAPVIISALIEIPQKNMCLGRLSWVAHGQWRHKFHRLGDLTVKRKVEQLADAGINVGSANAGDLAKFFQDFYQRNRSAMPRIRAHNTLGWQWGNTFLWGGTAISSAGREKAREAEPSQWSKESTLFYDDDPGTMQLALCYEQKGKADEWRRTIGRVCDFPALRLAVLSALATPLLEILDKNNCMVPNFMVEFSNTTSTGKTSLLRIAASCWGDANERGVGSQIGSWSASSTYIERMAQLRSGLPLFLDDTKVARRPEIITNTIYLIASGQGAGRGTVTGVQERRSFRTILVSTGEGRSVDLSKDGGTHARTISYWGAPFGEPSEEMGEILGDIAIVIRENHGHAGPTFVEWLCKRMDKASTWAESFLLERTKWMQNAESGPEKRQADYYALLSLTEKLAGEAGVLPWTVGDDSSLRELRELHHSVGDEADPAVDALDHLRSVCRSRRRDFICDDGINPLPHGGILGRWQERSSVTDGYIAIFPDKMVTMLEAGGFDPSSVRRAWNSMGICRGAACRINGHVCKVVRFEDGVFNDDIKGSETREDRDADNGEGQGDFFGAGEEH